MKPSLMAQMGPEGWIVIAIIALVVIALPTVFGARRSDKESTHHHGP